MRELAGTHYLGFEIEIERRLLTCSDESSSKSCEQGSTVSHTASQRLPSGSMQQVRRTPCANHAWQSWSEGWALGQGSRMSAQEGISHLPQTLLFEPLKRQLPAVRQLA